MKEIQLTQGKVALVDDEDYEELNKYKWCAHKANYVWYAIRSSPYVNGIRHAPIRMHRVIMNTNDGMYVDHIDGNGLNNTKENLRICTPSENQHNVGKRKDNHSGLKGVHFNNLEKKWKAQIQVNKKRFYLGTFTTKDIAYEAYCIACNKHHGEFAKFG